MRNQKGPRNIDLSRARKVGRNMRFVKQSKVHSTPQQTQQPPVQQKQVPQPQARVVQGQVAQSPKVTQKRPGMEENQQQTQERAAARSQARKKKQKQQKTTRIVLCIVAVLVIIVGSAYAYINSFFKTDGGFGNLTSNIKTPPEFGRDTINVLVLGIDYDENEGEIAQGIIRNENGNTDMILYVQFDKTAGTLKMLQIPRDCFVGPELNTGGTGRINALFACAPDTDNRVQYLAQMLYDQLGLPVDSYVTINMKALRELVDTFGGGAGIEVYIPNAMEYDGSRLEAGYHVLTGAELEFFLRTRKDVNSTPRGDVDRLNNQRYFYSAIFRYMKTMSWQEMVKLMPLFQKYINTDLNAADCAALGVALLNVQDENIVMGRLPVYGSQVLYNGSWVFGIPIQETNDFLNTYFRTAEAQMTIEELNIYTPPGAGGEVTDAEMSRVGGDGMVEAATDPAQTTDPAAP